MVYSGFWSSYEFLEFRIHIQTRIRIQSILFKHFWKLFKNKILINSDEKKNLLYQLYAIFYFSYYSYSPTVHTVQNSQA